MSSSTSDTSSNAAGAADFLDGFFKARAGLTSPGAPFELIDSADAQGHPLKAFKKPRSCSSLDAGDSKPVASCARKASAWSTKRASTPAISPE